MSATAIHSSPAQLSVLGHYTVSDEERVLVGRRIEGKVFVYDYPRDGQGRHHTRSVRSSHENDLLSRQIAAV